MNVTARRTHLLLSCRAWCDRALVREQLAVMAQHTRTITLKNAMIDKLTHELARLRRVQCAAKSERMDPGQRELFEAMMAADIAAVEAELEALQTANPTDARTHRRPIRHKLPADPPRVEVIHARAHDHCDHCGGALVKIGEHISEKLDVKPLESFVRKDMYPRYACRHCETIVAEPVAPAILDRGIAAPSLLAQVAIQKYADHLPLYRQEAIYASHGIELKRTTLAERIGVLGARLQPLVDRFARPVARSARVARRRNAGGAVEPRQRQDPSGVPVRVPKSWRFADRSVRLLPDARGQARRELPA